MNKAYRFTKMQGAGNDFVILDNRDGSIPKTEYESLAKGLCRRRISLGADGLMIVEKPRQDGDYAMVFYNADGSVGEMCGNGARCIARYGHDHRLAGEIQRIETTAGLVIGQRIRENEYRIRLNDPTVMEQSITVTVENGTYRCAYLELGCPGIPHAIVKLDDWDQWPEDDLRALGRQLRYAAAFPKGANVTFWKLLEKNHGKAITYERGVEDFTLACGTGAGSTAAAMRLLGFTRVGGTQLDFPGGTLQIELTEDAGSIRDIFLTGPAVTVAEGTVYYQ